MVPTILQNGMERNACSVKYLFCGTAPYSTHLILFRGLLSTDHLKGLPTLSADPFMQCPVLLSCVHAPTILNRGTERNAMHKYNIRSHNEAHVDSYMPASQPAMHVCAYDLLAKFCIIMQSCMIMQNHDLLAQYD